MNQVYCSADWHGSILGFKVLDYLDDSDKLYFLGDAVDRGEYGKELLDSLLNDNRVIFIKGNHEAMMADALLYLIKNDYCCSLEYDTVDLWCNNGGNKTLNKIEENSIKTENLIWYIEQINQMPIEIKYKSPIGHTIILEHAGYSPFDISHRMHDPLWDREHFYDNWVTGSEPSEKIRNTYLVHGHTPVQYLKYMYGYNGQQPLTKEEIKQKHEWLDWKNSNFNWKPTILRYCDGHKFDIDMCTIASNRIALLNLDTFEEIYFDGGK